MAWANIVRFADLISALFGLGGATVLAWPAFAAVRAKRNWEQLQKLKRSADDPETAAALDGLSRHVEAGQLGDPRGAFAFNAWGFSLLVISFAFLLLAAIGRVVGAE